MTSPYSMLPFMSWITRHLSPWPLARRHIPRAAVVLPLPSPVNT